VQRQHKGSNLKTEQPLPPYSKGYATFDKPKQTQKPTSQNAVDYTSTGKLWTHVSPKIIIVGEHAIKTVISATGHYSRKEKIQNIVGTNYQARRQPISNLKLQGMTQAQLEEEYAKQWGFRYKKLKSGKLVVYMDAEETQKKISVKGVRVWRQAHARKWTVNATWEKHLPNVPPEKQAMVRSWQKPLAIGKSWQVKGHWMRLPECYTNGSRAKAAKTFMVNWTYTLARQHIAIMNAKIKAQAKDEIVNAKTVADALGNRLGHGKFAGKGARVAPWLQFSPAQYFKIKMAFAKAVLHGEAEGVFKK